MKNGFTLTETLIVLSIVALLLGFGTRNTLSYYETLRLQQNAEKIAAQLRLAQNKAITSGETQSSNGVLFAASGFPAPGSKNTITITSAQKKTRKVIVSGIGRIRVE
jgi:prepilin-type N-terminal cleavage/methylation domain-containing protein